MFNSQGLYEINWSRVPKKAQYCKGCIFRGKTGSITTYAFLLATGKRRPCKAGKDCIVKETRGTRDRVGLIDSTTR